ncbi:MAG: rim15, signal transduction response regulator [Geoglossum umbratile]|nr:MAG: rim15, signal transduction response regulator [Geoglossum umbratile]
MVANEEPLPLPSLAVTTVKDDAVNGDLTVPGRMERTASMDIREEREDLKEAAEQTLNVIMDLSLGGAIRWVSPSWKNVIGTTAESVQGRSIAEIVLDNKDVFATAVESMKKDDSRSQIIRFSVQMGPLSKLATAPVETATSLEEGDLRQDETTEDDNRLVLEGQGIMVYDRSSGGESHTMWMLRPFVQLREITIDLPSLLVESLGVGAEMLARYLTDLAEVGANDPGNNAPPLPVLCRICERQIPPWWFEKHSELCLQEHKAEMEVQIAQENLTEHRNDIVKVLDALEARKSRQVSVDMLSPIPQAEYKGLPIGPPSTPSTGPSSGTASPASPPVRSRDSSASGFGHGRGRSFAIRRPQARIVELLLDLCDTAIEINIPAIKDSLPQTELRTQSPQSESRTGQVLQWQSPSTNTLEQEQGLALLCADTEAVARAKVEAVLRHRRIIEYAERIRIEFTLLVQECINEAMRKAAQIAAGELSNSSSSTDDETPSQDDTPFFAGSFDGPSSLAAALRNSSDPSIGFLGGGSSPGASTRSSSPKECPTPRSHKGAIKILGQSQHYKRSSIHFESDAGESDSSVRSSLIAAAMRTESPSSDHELRLGRTASSRDRKRSSLRLSGAASPHRQPSPSRILPPSSPLRNSKPRVPSLHDSLPSPITPPHLSAGDFSSPSVEHQPYSSRHHHHHHRRQSSAASSDVLRPPISPRLTTVNHPQPRAVPPSIKDFEIIKPISKGAFGSVYLSKKKSTGDYFAIKVLKKADMIAKNQVTNVKAERAIMMSQGESDFVAKLFWTFSSKDYLYLVMEYLNGGDCASLIKVLGGLPEDWAKKYLAEVVLGVEHLHGRGIVHRDLKPDNLLIDQNGHLKLTDFGLSRMGLVGRQKRILNSGNESTPDLLRQGPFARSMSVASSRSTSLDLHGNSSPVNTPLMTPDVGAQLAQPSYFNLNREMSLQRENSRRRSNHRSDSGGSETLQTMLSSFSLNGSFMSTQRSKATDEDNQSEGSSSSDFNNLPNVTSQPQNSTPPQSSMMPPQMALFDPEDTNRKFVGTPDYLAPETINGVGQDELSDWWSLGCILFEFLYGYPPFHADSPDKVFGNILQRRIDWPDDEDTAVSPEAKDLMNRLMCTDPRQRIGANIDEKFAAGGDEVKNHPWFAGINWDTLLHDEAQFVPAPENPEDTEYFDSRGATLQSFAEEMEDQATSPALTPGADYPERPHDALSRVRSQVNSTKRGQMPLHIPPHVRDGRSRRLSEPLAADDFGNFSFKNLPVLEKANKDVIQKLRAEALQAQGKSCQISTASNSPSPSLECSPVLTIPPKRQLSISSKTNNGRPVSPSALSQSNSSPSRPSQPSSPLLLSFTAGQNAEKRKTSSTSSSLSNNSLQPGSFFEVPRLVTTVKTASNASSPIKSAKSLAPLQISPQRTVGIPIRQNSISTGRTRSQTVGSQDGEPQLREVLNHHKRRSGVFDMSPSSSDNEETRENRANALLRVQRRRQSSRRLSQINVADGPMFRPLDVLICEDHPVSRMVMEKLLEKLRCRTMTVDNGPEAARCAMSEVKFDIIMMEFKLPQINGEDVARMIRDTKNANSQTPIVAVTGYLKDLQRPHHFDALIGKPPTTSKLIEVMSTLCQWKAPPSERIQALAPSGLRQQMPDDSPSSGSSGFAHLPGSGFQGSSREDSLGSSFYGDSESVMTDDAPVIISHLGTNEWEDCGLRIMADALTEPQVPRLIQQESAPPVLPSNTPKKQRSAEKVKAKRVSIEKKRYECAESGDDEDEELGNVHRSKSPQGPRARGGSKLGTEVMRTNSRGSVISGSGMSIREGSSPPGSTAEAVNSDETWTDVQASITPPVMFPKLPGDTVLDFDMDSTPKPSSHASQEAVDEEPTPRAPFAKRENL